MWPRRLPPRSLCCSASSVCALALAHLTLAGASGATLTAQRQVGQSLVRIQAQSARLAGAWVSNSGEQFQVTQADDTVEMTFSGPNPTARKGQISGSFDGAVLTGAYQATDGSTTDRGVVRFLRNPDGTLEGSWRSLVTGRQGNWSLTKK
jgi:hypothetical protein